MYTSFLGISEALHLAIFRKPRITRLSDSLFDPFALPSSGCCRKEASRSQQGLYTALAVTPLVFSILIKLGK